MGADIQTDARAPGKSSLDVLVVDDNPGDALLVKEYLAAGHWRHRVDTALTLGRGVAMLPDGYDVVVLDLHLPDAGPQEALRRTVAVAGATPIIVLTGASDRDLARSCLEHGAQDYVVKNEMSARELVRAVEFALARSRERALSSRLSDLERLIPLAELAEAIVHEISTPTTIVMMNSAELNDRLAGLAKELAGPHQPSAGALLTLCASAQDLVSQNIVGLNRVTRLLGDLRRLARPTAQDAGTTPGPIDVLDLCQGVVRTVSAHVARFARLDVVLRPVPQVVADPDRLGQVLLNLVMNAVHSIEGPPGQNTVSISTGSEGDSVLIEVSDTGCGIERERLEAIFDWFHTSRAARGGSGLGLPISREIVARAGGTLTVDSQVGVGSTFRVTLPAVGVAVDSVLPERG